MADDLEMDEMPHLNPPGAVYAQIMRHRESENVETKKNQVPTGTSLRLKLILAALFAINFMFTGASFCMVLEMKSEIVNYGRHIGELKSKQIGNSNGPVVMKGQKGEIGPTGPRGVQGSMGASGQKGEIGPTGPSPGEKGQKGEVDTTSLRRIEGFQGVRLVNGGSNYGRVEVLYDGVWGTICDNGWDTVDATVLCKMMGFRGAHNASTSAYYGQGSGQIWLDELHCHSSDKNVEYCGGKSWGVHDCTHSQDAGAVCYF